MRLYCEHAYRPITQAEVDLRSPLGVIDQGVALVFRPRRRIFRMGVDSLTVLVLYAVGIAGLVAVALGGGG